jgi:hypothetical protein
MECGDVIMLSENRSVPEDRTHHRIAMYLADGCIG